MLALPHTPHALVIRNSWPRRGTALAMPGRSVTSAMLPVASWSAVTAVCRRQILIVAEVGRPS